MADISKIKPNGALGEEYEIKDTTARTGVFHLNTATQSSKTIKSSVVTVNDAAPINAEDITVDITPVQDLHGYDKPWVGGAWKNKLKPHEVGSNSIRGLNVTYNADESISLTATAITGSTNYLYIDIYGANTTDVSLLSPLFNGLVAGGAIDLTLEGNPAGVGIICQFNRADGSLTTPISTYSSKITSTVPSDAVYVYVALVVKKDNVVLPINATVRAQISSTGSLQDWTPYSNICPIEGRTGAELDRVGKNWFDKNANNTSKGYKNNAYLYYNNVEGSADGWYISEYIRVTSIDSITLSGGRGNDPALCFYDADKHFISGVAYSSIMPKTFSIPSNSAYIRLSVPKDSKDTLQLELGTQPTTYEPYQGQQYTASFGETIHGGKWHVTKGETDKTYGNIANYNGETINEPWLSSMDEYSPGATPTTGAQVVYPLTTPTTISTPKQNVPMLQGINTVSANCGDTSLKYQPDNVIGELKGEIQKINSVRPKIYGFHIDGNESDPSAAVTYLQDAVGMRPAKMDYIKDVFDYGSWEDVWFVRDCKPCVLHRNGYVISYLDKNDFSKDIYGDPVYLSIPNHQVMIEFPKIWYKVVPDLNDSSSASVYISPVKLDEDYVDFAYIDSSGAHKEHFYMSAYNACAQTESGTRYLCSLSGQAVSKSLTGQNEIDACKALGTGWYTEDAGEITLINFLLILMGKSLDTKTVFGQGLHTGGSKAINDGFRTGVHNTKGMFYGTNSGAIASNNYNNAVKIFGIENYWGFQWRRYAGDMLVDGHRKIKLCYGNDDGSTTKEFNSTGDGYVDIGCTPSGTSGGYISKMKYTSNGMFSSVFSGTASTYYCSGQWYNNSGTMYALRGGASDIGARAGAFCVYLSTAFGYAWWNVGASPSYK